ncbi:MAG: VWA domain-containing protein [Acidobacteriota bacterium]
MKLTLNQLTTIFAALIAFAIGLSAQTPTPSPKVDDDIIKVESRLVVVPVSVTDGVGQPVLGLKADDFGISEEEKSQKIENLGSADVVPLEIAVLFDISASTDAMFKFEQETAAKFLKEVMRPIDRASVFTIGQKGVLVQPRDTAERTAASIKAISPTKEQTAFFDSIRFAADYVNKNSPQGVRKVIVIISDGEDTSSEGVVRAIWNAERNISDSVKGEQLRDLRVKARDGAKVAEQSKVVKSLQNADTVFYSINPAGSSYLLNKMSIFGQQNMQRFADDTGGTAFLPKFLPVDTTDTYQNENSMRKNQEMLELIFRQLANELRSQYLIQFYSDADFPVGRFVKLKVSLANKTGLRVRARDGYFVKN